MEMAVIGHDGSGNVEGGDIEVEEWEGQRY